MFGAFHKHLKCVKIKRNQHLTSYKSFLHKYFNAPKHIISVIIAVVCDLFSFLCYPLICSAEMTNNEMSNHIVLISLTHPHHSVPSWMTQWRSLLLDHLVEWLWSYTWCQRLWFHQTSPDTSCTRIEAAWLHSCPQPQGLRGMNLYNRSTVL